MLLSNVSNGAGFNSALHAGAGEGHRDLGGGSRGSTLTPTGNVVVAVCLGFIGTCGLANNLLVLLLYCRYKILRSPINLLLMNISVSDLLVCVLGTPFSFAASTQGRWLIGAEGCVWYGFANSLFAISDERARFSAYRRLLRQLPSAKRVTLNALFGHFHMVQTFSQVNKMSAHNLALVLVPSLFHSLNGDLLKLTRELVLYHPRLFLSREEELEEDEDEITVL